MSPAPLSRLIEVVKTHSRVTILVILVLTVVAGAGMTMIESPPRQQLASDSEAQQALDYVQANYRTSNENATVAAAYVRDGDGNVLTKAALLDALRFEEALVENETVASALAGGGRLTSVAGQVASTLADEPGASYAVKLEALEAADEAAVQSAIRQILGEESELLALMPNSYQPGTTSAESMRIVLRYSAESDDVVSTVEAAVYDESQAATTDGSREFFTLGGPPTETLTGRLVGDNLGLIGPLALVLIVVTLTFAYRDLGDLLVGIVGVLLTLVWMFGLIGWLDVPFGSAGIIAPILLIGLSIDYGIHVFMRYREARAENEDIRTAMGVGLSGVGIALVLVTVTTALGFLANLSNSLNSIRQLAIATAIGIVAALVVFITIVPALKIELDGLLERVGFDRAKRPIGVSGGRLSKFLTAGVSAARISAVAVILVAAVAGAGGAYAWSDLDREVGSYPDEPADWKQSLPEPLAINEYPFLANNDYVREHYRSSSAAYSPAQILIEGDPTADHTLQRVATATEEITQDAIVYRRADGTVPIRSPLTVIEQTANRDETVAEVVQSADTDGDGIPDQNLKAVYDAVFAVAPGEASSVIERTDGTYRSLRIVIPMRQTADAREVAGSMETAAATIDGSSLSATATGDDLVIDAEADRITENMLLTLVISLLAVLGLLIVIYRVVEGSATLGVVTVLPVALVVAWVIGGMWLFEVPLTLFTALMISLAIGLGVDYSIHVSERFAQELDEANDIYAAMETAVIGTGGALLGSTATTVGAFGTLSLATFPALRQMGLMVGLALLLSFVASVFVLPSLLAVWARLVGVSSETTQVTERSVPEGME